MVPSVTVANLSTIGPSLAEYKRRGWFMRKALVLMCALTLITARGTGSIRASSRAHAKRLVNRESLGRTAAGATWGQLRNSPHEWGQRPPGFGKRFASALGPHAVKTTIQPAARATHPHELP